MESTSRAPPSAARGCRANCVPVSSSPIVAPRYVIKATPKVAPGVMPMRKGPARGFRKRVCIIRPLHERAMPPRVAAITRGKCRSQKMVSPPVCCHRCARGSRSSQMAISRSIPSSRVSRGRRPRRFTAEAEGEVWVRSFIAETLFANIVVMRAFNPMCIAHNVK